MGGERQHAAAERDQAKQKDEAAGQPHATLPPGRREHPADTAHHQHRGESPQSERQHDENAGHGASGARRLDGEGINQRAREKAVEHAKGNRSGSARCLQQTAQGHGECAAEADSHTMKALEHSEKLQRHGDHEEPSGDRQQPLGGVERTAQHWDRYSSRGAQHLAQRAGHRTQETVGGQSARVVEQVAPHGRGRPARIATERTGKAPAHADAVKAACEAGGKYHQIVGHWQIT
jgi:hypothetical protein